MEPFHYHLQGVKSYGETDYTYCISHVNHMISHWGLAFIKDRAGRF